MTAISNEQKAVLHIAKQQLAMQDAEYIELLQTYGGVTSSKYLDKSKFEAVLHEFCARGFIMTGHFKRNTPAGESSKKRLLYKISNQLAGLSLPPSYVAAIAKKRFGVDRLEWCDAAQLHKLVAMLAYHQKRENDRKTPRKAAP